MQRFPKEPAVGRHDLAPFHEVLAPVRRGHEPARFAHQQHPGGEVPLVQTDSPEAVEPPGRDVGEVERRRAGPSADHPAMGEGRPGSAVEALRHGQGEHRVGQGIVSADPDPAAVELGAPDPVALKSSLRRGS